MARRTMYVKLLAASLANRRTRAATMLAAIIICAAVVSCITSIYRDIGVQVGEELRHYGANMVALPQSPDKFIDPALADRAARSFGDKLVGYSPFLYGQANLGRSEVVVVGVRLSQLKKVSPYLKISGSGEGPALVGERLAEKLGLAAKDKLTLSFAAREKVFEIGGLVESGGVEEDQIFIELESAQDLLGQPRSASLAYYSVLNPAERRPALISNKASDKQLQLEPIARITRSETRVLDTVRTLIFSVAGMILVTSALAVTTTMMAVVIERRREVGLKKALGADDRSILLEFAGEGLALGLVGGLLGWLGGYLAAQWIGQTVFNAFVSFSPTTLLITVGTSLAVAVIAMSVPVRLALQVEPAPVLRGE